VRCRGWRRVVCYYKGKKPLEEAKYENI